MDDTTTGNAASISLVAGLAPAAYDHRAGSGLLREELPAALAPEFLALPYHTPTPGAPVRPYTARARAITESSCIPAGAEYLTPVLVYS